jgi:UDP-N-acetylmuramyl pentapeptide synthase
MKRTKYTAEFKTEAVKQVTEKGHLVDALKHDGILILNSDDADVFAFKNKI